MLLYVKVTENISLKEWYTLMVNGTLPCALTRPTNVEKRIQGKKKEEKKKTNQRAAIVLHHSIQSVNLSVNIFDHWNA